MPANNLVYLGGGERYLISVPARDLDEADLRDIAALGLPALGGVTDWKAVMEALVSITPPLYAPLVGKGKSPAPAPEPEPLEVAAEDED